MNQTVTTSPSKRFGIGAQAAGRLALNIHRAPFYFLLAFVLTFAVECLSRRSISAAAVFLWERPLAFFTNYGIILLTVLPALLFRKRVAGLVLLTSIWSILGVAQCIVLLSRVSPLSAVDIAIVFSVITIITVYLSPFQIVLIGLAVAGLLTSIVFLFIKSARYKVEWKRFAVVYLASLLATVLVILGGFATGQLSDKFPNLATAYNDYGFPYCFGISVVDKGVDRPDEYGEKLITDILEELPKNDSLPPSTDEISRPNVIVVQLESFFDVKYLEGVTYSADPIPYFTALKEQYPSGLFHVPVIGAGTVNTEFEVLTGMNVMDFGAGEYPFRSILLEKTCETIAYDLLSSGYRTHAIHNHEGDFYMRNEVYKNLGFEDFTSIEYFENPTFNENNWAHDALLTDEILQILHTTEESDFIFAVSVQGHGKYPDSYIPAADDVLVTGGMESGTVRSHYNYYINQLREMDAFVGALYEAVMSLEEETILVFYGDHLPSIARDEGISLKTSEFQTEYIIISNYDTPVSARDGELHAYQLFPTVMEIIGNDEGVMNRFHRAYWDNEKYLELLSSLEYDILYGHRIAYGNTEYPTMEHMQMGTRPIRVTGYYVEGEYLYVTGNHFTTYSRITLDGRERKTEWINSTTLRVADNDPARLIERADELTVRQLSATGEVLSETPRIILLHPEIN